MSVIAIPHRGRRLLTPARPGRAPGVSRRSTGPALTVTFTVPLAGEPLSPHAFKLLEVVRELVELGEGTVTVAPTGQPPQVSYPFLVEGDVDAEAPATQDPDELRVLVASRSVVRGDATLSLTRLEFDLLRFLVENPRRVFSRVQLLGAVWGYEHAVARTVDVHVRRLRAKIGEQVPLITTVYGVGYRLSDEARISVETDD